ncbi:DivIVA domain-containing protein [Fodinicola feengrottensis]|uniref:Cell wall synthesis protein Wag31 n=1 Tax=Fodinicola feengrottensis TaxID=435914 RepID=A0ABN2HRH0_9ACTN
MPLTPADVHNVAFKKPPIGKRGYDEEEVDAFLDEVERELARLIEENNDLRAQAGGRAGAASTPVRDDADSRRLAQENSELKGQMDRLRQEAQAAQQAAQQAQQAASRAQDAQRGSQPQMAGAMGGLTSGEPGGEQALRVLMLAQRTADDHVGEARREAEKLLTDARAKADELTRNARAKAEALEQEARQRHQEAMGSLDAKRSALQKHIEELKSFEREYRTRLKAFLETQLRDLTDRGQAIETESRSDRSSASTSSTGINNSTGVSGSFGGGVRGLGLDSGHDSRY